MQKAFESDEDNDKLLKNYLADSSDDEDDEEDKPEDDEQVIAKYRALLQGSTLKSNDEVEDDEAGMEMTFVPEAEKKKAQEKAKVKDMTPWEKYLHKKKEKRKEKRATQTVSKEEEREDDEEIPSDVDLSDPFFQENAEPSAKSKKKENKRPDLKRKKSEEGGSKEIGRAHV